MAEPADSGNGSPELASPENPAAGGRRLPARGHQLIASVGATLDDVHVRPDVPKKMERNIRKSAAIPEWETVLAFVDCTVFNSGKDGLALGEVGVYYNHSVPSDGPAFQSWESIARLGAHAEPGKVPTCIIGGVEYQVSGSAVDREAMCRLLVDTARTGWSPGPPAAEPAVDLDAEVREAPAATEPDESEAAASSADDPLTLGSTLILAVVAAALGLAMGAAGLWLAVPWGPTWTEAGVVTEVDRSQDIIGGKVSNRYLVYVTSNSGTDFRLDSPPLSAYATPGQEVTVERSSWTDEPLRVQVPEGSFGKGEGFGLLVRGAGLLAVAAVTVAALLSAVAAATDRLVFGVLLAAAYLGGGWLGLQLLLT